MTELLDAIADGKMAAVRDLLARRADPNERDAAGWFPLLMAAVVGPCELVALLIDAGAHVNAQAPDGATPLMKAAVWQQVEIVTLLLAQGADPRMTDERGWTARSFASHLGHRELVELLEQVRGDAETQTRRRAEAER